MNPKRMPGPGFFRSLQFAFRFRKNYLIPMEELFAEYGDYVSFGGGPPAILAYHPEAVEHVLRKNHKNYLKAPDLRELHPVLGNGLLTSEGEEWKEHRRIIAPEFQHKKIEAFYLTIQRHLQMMIHEWRLALGTFDIAPAISKTTYGIAGECFFGVDVTDTSGVVYQSIDLTSEFAVRRMGSPFKLPLAWPLPSHRRVWRAIRAMDDIVYRIIDERLANPSDAHDVLSRLTKAEPGSRDPKLSRKQIRDEVMTLLLAGHETTANALSWTLFLLGRHPDLQERLRDEVKAHVAGDIPTIDELKNLRYTKMVLEESMRLYPPAATIGRYSIEEDEIGGYPIRAKTVVNLVQWITHRHPEFWPEAETFNPERFAAAGGHHPFAYFPFAAGPRECVGRNLAMVEGIALLAGMIRSFRFELMNHDVKVRPLITLRPDPGVVMRLSRVD